MSGEVPEEVGYIGEKPRSARAAATPTQPSGVSFTLVAAANSGGALLFSRLLRALNDATEALARRAQLEIALVLALQRAAVDSSALLRTYRSATRRPMLLREQHRTTRRAVIRASRAKRCKTCRAALRVQQSTAVDCCR